MSTTTARQRPSMPRKEADIRSPTPDPPTDDDLLTPRVDPTAMDTVHWPGLAARLPGRPIVDLWHDTDAGAVTIVLERGSAVSVGADWEGCQVVCQDAEPATKSPPRTNG